MAGNDRFPVGNRAWLGAGMMAAGLGAAVASGCGLATATAEETAGSAGAPRSTAEATQPRTSPMTARTAPTSAVRGPRTVLRGRTAAGAPLPMVRVEAVTERVADAAGTSTDTGDGLIVDVSIDQPVDRRKQDADARPARAERDSSRPDADDSAQQRLAEKEPEVQALQANSAAAAAVPAAAARPVTLGGLVSGFLSRIKAFNVNFLKVSLPSMVTNWWREVRNRLFGVPSTPVVVPPNDPPEPEQPSASPPEEPVLLWETNFTSLEEAMQSWSLQSGRWGAVAGENQYYTPDFSNVTVDAEGHLIITVRREPTPDNAAAPDNYTSARVVSYGNQSVQPNSRIVARMQLPYAAGLLPAFWMVGLEPGHEFDWPRQGEVDIVEYPGFGSGDASTHWTGNVHGPANSDNTVDVKLHDIGGDLGVDLSQGFHEYGIDWYTDRIVWHIDGVQTGQVTQAEYEALGGDWTPFSGAWPHYLILNVAVGHDWTGDPDPSAPFADQQMKVDWVKVYQLQP